MTEASIAFVAGGSLAQRRNGTAGRLRDARTCYSHLAGRLGVALADALVAARWLEEDGRSYRLTAAGTRSLRGLGIEKVFNVRWEERTS